MTARLGERLVGRALPPVRLPSTEGGEVDLWTLRGAWAVVYTYPKNMVGMPGVTIPEGWRETPGLSGCTAEACGFRDAYADLMGRSTKVYGVSDADLRLARALNLPTIAIAGETLLRRLTLIADPQGVVRKVYDEIPDPGGHALEVARYLEGARGNPT